MLEPSAGLGTVMYGSKSMPKLVDWKRVERRIEAMTEPRLNWGDPGWSYGITDRWDQEVGNIALYVDEAQVWKGNSYECVLLNMTSGEMVGSGTATSLKQAFVECEEACAKMIGCSVSDLPRIQRMDNIIPRLVEAVKEGVDVQNELDKLTDDELDLFISEVNQ